MLLMIGLDAFDELHGVRSALMLLLLLLDALMPCLARQLVHASLQQLQLFFDFV